MTYDYKQFANEQQLFDFIKDNFIKDLHPSEYSTSRYDCFSERYQMDIELKCRRKHYEGLIIEKGKYDALMNRCKTYGTTPVYINSTPEGVWGFYLEQFDLVWEHRDLPKQTDFSRREKISKEISYLPVLEGIDLLSLLNKSSSSF